MSMTILNFKLTPPNMATDNAACDSLPCIFFSHHMWWEVVEGVITFDYPADYELHELVYDTHSLARTAIAAAVMIASTSSGPA